VTELILTRGLPSSGKTTWALAWVAEDEENRARVNRDDLRQTLYGRHWPVPERQVTVAQHAAVRALLEAGVSVVVDDTNLRARHARDYADIAADLGVDFRVKEIAARAVTCITWDAARALRGERAVGADVILQMDARYRDRPPIVASERAPAWRYVPDDLLPKAWIVDLDGTLALMGDRSPYDWSRVGEDALNEPVARLAWSLAAVSLVVVLSGRDAVCRPQTEAWLKANEVEYEELLMRPAGDTRKDSIVKLELFHEVAARYHVLGAVDDRDQVVAMWRSIGLLCAQVAPGNF
jgi:predicted kinase